jgi:hypothetical protein
VIVKWLAALLTWGRGVSLRHWAPGTWRRRCVNVAGFSVLLAVAWPVGMNAPRQPVTLKIVALGEKHPDSKGTEVWLAGLPPEISAEALRTAQTPPASWSNRDGVYVSHTVQPAVLTWTGMLGPDSKVSFGRHPWSGKARVDIVGGGSKTVDLFSADPVAALVVTLDDLLPTIVPSSLGWYAANLLTMASMLAIPLGLAAWLLGRQIAERRRRAFVVGPWHDAVYWHDVVRFATPSIVIFGLVLLATWPAQMSPDSVGQWKELSTRQFSNAHPLIHTLLFGGPGKLFGTPAVSSFLQIVLFAFVIGGVITEMVRAGVSRPICYAVSILLPMFPPVHILSTVFWKDIPYTIALVGLLWLLLALLRNPSDRARDTWFVWTMAIVLSLVGTMRHNGLLVSAGMIVVLVLIGWRSWPRRLFGIASLGAIVAPVLWTYIVLPGLGVPGIGRHFTGAIPMHALAHAVQREVITDPETRQRLAAILPLQRWKELNVCHSLVPLFFNNEVHYDRIDATLFKPLLGVIARHPVIMAEHYACITSIVWRLSPLEDSIYTLAPLMIWSDPTTAALGLTYSPRILALNSFLMSEFQLTTTRPIAFTLFWRPALFLFAMLAVGLMVWRQDGAKPTLLIASPVLLNTISQIPLLTAQDFRYQFPVTVLGLLIIPLWLYKAKGHVLEPDTSPRIA